MCPCCFYLVFLYLLLIKNNPFISLSIPHTSAMHNYFSLLFFLTYHALPTVGCYAMLLVICNVHSFLSIHPPTPLSNQQHKTTTAARKRREWWQQEYHHQ